eukprot:1370688-Ditylum_brightwellii.AAC.1
MLQRNGINDSPTTSRNPQENSVCEWLHQTVANTLQTTTSGAMQNMEQANQAIDNALAAATHATQCAVSRALGISPEALIFQWDMFLNLPIIADLLNIRDKRQVMINENLRRQNPKRREWDYMVGQE